MIVTIDGPAGAGKSTASRTLAKRMGFRFLDTGAMYRAVALAAMQHGIEWSDAEGLARLAHTCDVDVNEDRVLLDGINVTSDIRALTVTSVIHHVAENQEIRSTLVDLQRRIASQGDFVTERRLGRHANESWSQPACTRYRRTREPEGLVACWPGP